MPSIFTIYFANELIPRFFMRNINFRVIDCIGAVGAAATPDFRDFAPPDFEDFRLYDIWFL